MTILLARRSADRPDSSTGGGNRTHTGVPPRRILSPLRLPFRHAGTVLVRTSSARHHPGFLPGPRPGEPGPSSDYQLRIIVPDSMERTEAGETQDWPPRETGA